MLASPIWCAVWQGGAFAKRCKSQVASRAARSRASYLLRIGLITLCIEEHVAEGRRLFPITIRRSDAAQTASRGQRGTLLHTRTDIYKIGMGIVAIAATIWDDVRSDKWSSKDGPWFPELIFAVGVPLCFFLSIVFSFNIAELVGGRAVDAKIEEGRHFLMVNLPGPGGLWVPVNENTFTWWHISQQLFSAALVSLLGFYLTRLSRVLCRHLSGRGTGLRH